MKQILEHLPKKVFAPPVPTSQGETYSTQKTIMKEETLMSKPLEADSPLKKLNKFIVTKEKVNDMVESKMIWYDIIALGHISVWSGQGNSGKTTLALQAAKDLAQQGFEVLYFQEDAGAGEFPSMQEHAEKNNYSLLNSTLAQSSQQELLKFLYDLSLEKSNLSGYVMFFDTLKKFCDIMGKSGTREFFMLMRSLSTKGATIVLLGHNTKRPTNDGKPIFDGVGDTRNDVDELIYIESTEKDDSGFTTITMKPDKVRCVAKPISFKLNTQNLVLVVLDETVDVSSFNQSVSQFERDKPVIDMVKEELGTEVLPITTLANMVTKRKDCKYGFKYIKALIERYIDTNENRIAVFWYESKERLNNARMICLAPF